MFEWIPVDWLVSCLCFPLGVHSNGFHAEMKGKPFYKRDIVIFFSKPYRSTVDVYVNLEMLVVLE